MKKNGCFLLALFFSVFTFAINEENKDLIPDVKRLKVGDIFQMKFERCSDMPAFEDLPKDLLEKLPREFIEGLKKSWPELPEEASDLSSDLINRLEVAMMPGQPGFSRQHSNYGYFEISANEDHWYQVKEISHKTRHQKGWREESGLEEKGRKPREGKFLYLRRQKPAQTERQDIFWYINAEDSTIRSFEDGHFIATITDIRI